MKSSLNTPYNRSVTLAYCLQIDVLDVDGKFYGFSGCHRFEVLPCTDLCRRQGSVALLLCTSALQSSCGYWYLSQTLLWLSPVGVPEAW